MKNKKTKITAIIVSVVVHLIFVFSSSVYELKDALDQKIKKAKKIQVQLSKKDPKPPKKVVDQTPQTTQPLKFESPIQASSLQDFLNKEESAPLQKDMGLPEKKMKQLARMEVPEKLFAVKPDQPEYKLPKKVKERETKDKVTASFKIDYDNMKDAAEEHSTVGEVSVDFFDKMPGFTPAFITDSFDGAEYSGRGIDATGQLPMISRLKSLASFDRELVWALETYQDSNDGQKYFKVRIRAGSTEKNLPTIPKELLILVDCSKSITDDRLDRFKEGIQQSLEFLNPTDVFNVIFFKEWNFVFQPESVPATQENIEKLMNFMKQYKVGEKTDTFRVLEENIQKTAQLNPSYILLLSDGRPTKGITNARELINKISDLNQGQKPIFTLTGGNGSNRYLLDFISYKNRAWNEYSYRTHMIDEKIVELVQKIKDPIIMDMRYFITGVSTEEAFPKELADFYRNAEFTLYGRYDDEEEFAMQLLGDVEGETKEFLLKSEFAKAEVGDATIAENWAYNKIYHLISQLQYNQDNTALLEQIKVLSAKFNVKTPYLEDILN